MGYSNGHAVEILEKLLRISISQTRLAEEGKFEEVLKLHELREVLFNELKRIDCREEDLKALADDILKSDTALAGLIERSIVDSKGRLEKIGRGSRAAKAYTTF